MFIFFSSFYALFSFSDFLSSVFFSSIIAYRLFK